MAISSKTPTNSPLTSSSDSTVAVARGNSPRRPGSKRNGDVSREIEACEQWLEGEIQAVRPHVIVCLGATAARALLGATFRVSTMRGRFVPSPNAPFVFATLHPSALLRLRDETERETQFKHLVEDLSLIHKALRS